jgi:hypothetical protein
MEMSCMGPQESIEEGPGNEVPDARSRPEHRRALWAQLTRHRTPAPRRVNEDSLRRSLRPSELRNPTFARPRPNDRELMIVSVCVRCSLPDAF